MDLYCDFHLKNALNCNNIHNIKGNPGAFGSPPPPPPWIFPYWIAYCYIVKIKINVQILTVSNQCWPEVGP